eukprot:Opistho-1_new@103421
MNGMALCHCSIATCDCRGQFNIRVDLFNACTTPTANQAAGRGISTASQASAPAVASSPFPPSDADAIACAACGKGDVKLLKCGACLVVRYCSRECQKAAWPQHRQACAGQR